MLPMVFTRTGLSTISRRLDGELAQGQANAKVLSNGAQQGESSNGFRGYYPPCPPIGSTHRYIFRLYALDRYLTLPTADRAAIDQALARSDNCKDRVYHDVQQVTSFFLDDRILLSSWQFGTSVTPVSGGTWLSQG